MSTEHGVRSMEWKLRLVGISSVLCVFAASALEPIPTPSQPRPDPAGKDKGDYNLFNPTPRELMREMSTDRPDKTESPYTVDAGHYQAEMSFIDYVYDRYNPERMDSRVETFTVAPMNLKVGLLNNVDLQIGIDPYVAEKTDTHADSDDDGVGEDDIDKKSGFGDMQTRLKINVWGNDEGPTAFAVMPFIKWPTNGANLGNNAVEGGLIFPFGTELPCGWGMGIMPEVDFVRNEANQDYHAEFVNTITFGHDIVGDLAGYIEFISVNSTEAGTHWAALMGGGLTYAVNEDVQLDCGANFGLTRAADDINLFMGISIRH